MASRPPAAAARSTRTADDDDDDEGVLALGAIVHLWLSLKSFLRRTVTHYRASRSPARLEPGDGYAPGSLGDERVVRPAGKRPATGQASRREPEFAAGGAAWRTDLRG